MGDSITMTDKCDNHPNADAIEHCAKCSIALCGMCAKFTETEVLCENCGEAREAEKAVELQRRKLAMKEAPAEVQSSREEKPAYIRRKSSNIQILPVLVIIVCVGIIAVRQLFYSTPEFVPIDDETRARLLLITSFTECLQVFEQIGQVLARGDMPNDSLRCDASGQSNIITEVGNDVIVEHPQPDFYGYTRIYVSQSNPRPTIIE